MFQPVSSKVNFPQLEEEILELWGKKNVFERSIDARKGAPRFMLYEGPPTANGSPGIHHVLSRVFKDVIPRYKVMKGYYAPRIAGWDTHGLPVELEIEKELGFSSKTDIEEYGIAKFNARCRESVFRYLEEWEAITKRVAFWVDMGHPYITMDNSYIESGWWVIKQLWDKGLVYQGYKVTPHCPRCVTSLSSHEVSLGYQDDVSDPSVYIKFKIDLSSLAGSKAHKKLLNLFQVSGNPAYFLVWTTTPWTLPGNTALAVAPEADYAVVEMDNEYLILANALLEKIGLDNHKVVAIVKGTYWSYLVKTRYEPLFNPHEYGVGRRRFQANSKLQPQTADKKLTYHVITGNFVSMEEGTGIVHVAPAYGEVDYEAGAANNLDFVHMVDLQGKITGTYPFSGKFVKDADEDIIADLDARGIIFHSETIHHTYPFCWRCETPLLYYAKQTWYIRTTAFKDKLIASNNKINWHPKHIKHGRFGDWLENNVDWAFSRERYWGTPAPIWQCKSCGKYECIGSLKELNEKPGFTGLKEPLDLHRPFVDEITYDCPECKSNMRRVTDVIDCWFDSGAMPIAQWHYPFENNTLLKDDRFPANYICEAVDQTRGWFYSLHAISILLFDRISFENVICLGHILDAKGDKMSTSKGNAIEPWAVINKYGADAVRWYFFTASPPGNSRRFSEQLVSEVTRQFLLTLWNVYSFFVIYANIDKFTPDPKIRQLEQSELDRWISSELNKLIVDVDTAFDGYNPTEAGRKIESFVSSLSKWYVRRSRRRFWKSGNDADKLAAYTTLYQCLVTLSQLLAPLTPFLAEELYQNLVCSVFPKAPDSVHLTNFPVADKTKIDEHLSVDTQLVMKVSSLGRATRSQAGIKVRQPLAEVIVSVANNKEQNSLKRLKPQILEELNVKDLKFIDNAGKLNKKNYIINSEGNYSVAISTKISPKLKAEGLAREIIHRLQTMRRQAGFDIADHITTCYQGDAYIKQVIETFASYIKRETLSLALIDEAPSEGVFTESYKLADHCILLGVAKLDTGLSSDSSHSSSSSISSK